MLLRDLERLVDAFLDRHRRHDDHELGEAVPLVQLEDRAQIDVGLAGAGLHLDREVAGGERADGGRPLRSWMALRFSSSSSSSSVRRLPMPRSFSQAQAKLRGPTASRVTVNSVRQISWPRKRSQTASIACELVVEIGLEVQFHRLHPRYRLRTFSSPCCWRMAVRLVLATSSAKALSRKTTVVSPAGASSLCQLDDAERERLHVGRSRSARRDRRAGPAADAVDGLAGDRLLLDGHAGRGRA